MERIVQALPFFRRDIGTVVNPGKGRTAATHILLTFIKFVFEQINTKLRDLGNWQSDPLEFIRFERNRQFNIA